MAEWYFLLQDKDSENIYSFYLSSTYLEAVHFSEYQLYNRYYYLTQKQ